MVKSTQEQFLRGRDGLHARVVILTVIEEEFRAVLDQEPSFQRNFVPEESFRFRNDLGDGVYDLVVAKIGQSTNTICSNFVRTIAERLRPEFLILCGIAGGIESRWGVALGNVIVANHIEGYEQQKRTEDGVFRDRVALDQPSFYLMQRIVERVSDGEWRTQIKAKRPEKGHIDLVLGNLISGEKLLGDGRSAYQREVLTEFNNAKAVDMESFGLARCAYELRATRHYNFHYIVVRSISDVVETAPSIHVADNGSRDIMARIEGNQATRDKWRDYAACAAAAFSLSVANEILTVTGSDSWKRTK